MVYLKILSILLIFLVCEWTIPALSQADSEKLNSELINNLKDQNIDSKSTTVEVPAPLAVALPKPAESLVGFAQTPLSWRCRAMALANEYPLKKNGFAWVLPITYNKAQNLLKQTVEQLGMEISSQYTQAGQFLILMPETTVKTEIIIVSQPVNQINTLFKMRTYANGRAVDNKKADSISETMKSILANQGLWQ